jgi:hypothetical protein
MFQRQVAASFQSSGCLPSSSFLVNSIACASIWSVKNHKNEPEKMATHSPKHSLKRNACGWWPDPMIWDRNGHMGIPIGSKDVPVSGYLHLWWKLHAPMFLRFLKFLGRSVIRSFHSAWITRIIIEFLSQDYDSRSTGLNHVDALFRKAWSHCSSDLRSRIGSFLDHFTL